MQRRAIYFLFICLTGLFSVQPVMASASPLPASQAFVLSVSQPSAHELRVEWRIAPQYYLYTKQMHIIFSPHANADVRLPQGDLQYDPVRGRFEAYSGYVNIPVVFRDKINPALSMSVHYQGCSHEGFCYPPMAQTFALNLAAGTLYPVDGQASSRHEGTAALLTNQHQVNALLQQGRLGLTLLIFVGLGLLLAFTPCVLPMVPILTGIIAGHKPSPGVKKTFLLTVTYVLGTSLTYALAGVMAASMGGALQRWLQSPWIIVMLSGLFVLLALSLFDAYELRLPGRLAQYITSRTNRQTSGSYVGVFCMGVLATLIVSPCITAPLAGVLMYIGQTGNQLLGALALFALGIGMGIPLLIVGLSAGHLLPRTGPWMAAVKQLSGCLMFAMAVWMLSRIMGPAMVKLLWGVFLLGMAIFLTVSLPRLIKKTFISRFLGLACGSGGFIILFAAVNAASVTQVINIHSERAASVFTVIQDIEDLQRQLLMAKVTHQPVLLDFYARWCASCVTMDTEVFNDIAVKKALSHYKLLRIDLTANNEKDQALLKYFDVIAPPTMLFFDAAGAEVYSKRIAGELDAKEFLNRMQAQR